MASPVRRPFFVFAAVLLVSHHPAASALVNGFRRAPPVKLSEEMGCSPTLSLLFSKNGKPVFFDPLNFADDDNFAFFREAELKHGRVCMLATLGMMLTSSLDDASDMVISQLMRQLTFSEQQQQQQPPFLSSNNPRLATEALSPQGALSAIVVCGILESRVFVQQDYQDMPGDYGTGYFGSRNKARNERSLISELENGRLAMIAFLIQLIGEVVFRKNCWALLHDILSLSFPVFSS